MSTQNNSKGQRKPSLSRGINRKRIDSNNEVVQLARLLLCGREEDEIREYINAAFPKYADDDAAYKKLYAKAILRCRTAQDSSIEKLLTKNISRLGEITENAYLEGRTTEFLRCLELLNKMAGNGGNKVMIASKEAIATIQFAD